MAHISREDYLERRKSQERFLEQELLKDPHAEVQEPTIDIEDLFDAWNKMQQIEQIVDEMWDENSYYNNAVRFAEKIEQIVKGDSHG